MVYAGGEMSVIEYGRNEVLGTCRTDTLNPYLLSVAVQDARGSAPESKKMAYALDVHTLRIVDLTAAGGAAATVNHDERIDWLELNQRGTQLLFRARPLLPPPPALAAPPPHRERPPPAETPLAPLARSLARRRRPLRRSPLSLSLPPSQNTTRHRHPKHTRAKTPKPPRRVAPAPRRTASAS